MNTIGRVKMFVTVKYFFRFIMFLRGPIYCMKELLEFEAENMMQLTFEAKVCIWID